MGSYTWKAAQALALLPGIVLGVLVWAFSQGALAQEKKTEDKVGYNPISKEELVTHLRAGGPVEGVIIRGEDLLDIIREIQLDIHIRKSIIVGGLDFRNAPRRSLHEIQLPASWSEEDRRNWIEYKRTKGLEMIPFVANTISIVDTHIVTSHSSIQQPFQSPPSSIVNAEHTFFQKAEFPNVIIDGVASFAGATFGDKAVFVGASFRGEANFSGVAFGKEAFFFESQFSGKADFAETLFTSEADFDRTTFGSEASFPGTLFGDKAGFAWVTFGKQTDFIKAIFRENLDFSNVVFHDITFFNQSHFGKMVDFTGGIFHRDAFFKNAEIREGKISFKSTKFKGDADFSGVTCRGEADFFRTSFGGKANFEATELHGKASFLQTTFSNQANFVATTFRGEANFNDVTFDGEADFSESTFSAEAHFQDTTLRGEASFLVAIFNEAYFTGASFNNTANFAGAKFSKTAHVIAVSFDKHVSFKDTEFLDLLDLRLTTFKAYADLRGAKIKKLDFNNDVSPVVIDGHLDFRQAEIAEAHFQNIIFLKDVDFSGARFGSAAPSQFIRYHSVTFDANAYYVGAEFCSGIILDRVNFKKDANFLYASFKKICPNSKPKIFLSYISFTNLRLEWQQLPSPEIWLKEDNILKTTVPGAESQAIRASFEPRSAVFKNLETHFRSNSQLEDTNEAYYYMKVALLSEECGKKSLLECFWPKTEWLIWGRCCGYGTKPWRIVMLAMTAYLIFALLYYLRGNFVGQFRSKDNEGSTLKLQLFVSPKRYLTEPTAGTVNKPEQDGFQKTQDDAITQNSWQTVRTQAINAFLLSLVLLFKVGYQGATIAGRLGKVDVKYLVKIEWALGYILLLALVFTLKNTSPLISALMAFLF